ncbi:MAG: hypothetical protein IPG92_00165 [Flavobacteriales bacterium]|nr:hypothetical protein [Flavobacteriales bacterium]
MNSDVNAMLANGFRKSLRRKSCSLLALQHYAEIAEYTLLAIRTYAVKDELLDHGSLPFTIAYLFSNHLCGVLHDSEIAFIAFECPHSWL